MNYFAAFIIGLLIGIGARALFFEHQDINIANENHKLRKENEVLWARLKKENKIEKF